MDDETRSLLDRLKRGEVTPEIIGKLMSIATPEDSEEIMKVLETIVEPPKTPQIADYYREGEGSYDARWPITVPLPLPFEALDRKTRFFVLFGEWTRREAEGMVALVQGRLDEADATFLECLERARQIDVAELAARSFEGRMRVAGKRGDRRAEEHLRAEAARAREA